MAGNVSPKLKFPKFLIISNNSFKSLSGLYLISKLIALLDFFILSFNISISFISFSIFTQLFNK